MSNNFFIIGLPQNNKRHDQIIYEENLKGFYCFDEAIVTFFADSIVGFCDFAEVLIKTLSKPIDQT
jgi:hypothetical protein